MNNNAISFDNDLNIYLINFKNFKNIKYDKVIYEIHKIIIFINKKLFKTFLKLNKLLLIFDKNISDEYIINKLNKIKSKIYNINSKVVSLLENKSEIDFISELDNHENVYEYKLASEYIQIYIESLIRANIAIANKTLYIDNIISNILF